MPVRRGSLKVETRQDILLALLGSRRRAVRGITRLVKLLFLAREEAGADKWLKREPYYGYRPYKIGPFSADVYEDVELLEDSRLIKVESTRAAVAEDMSAWEEEFAADFRPEPGPGGAEREVNRKFSLTEDGRKCADSILESMSGEQRAALESLRKRYDRMSLRQLLVYVYTRYPDWTQESEIKADLGID